MATIGSLIVDLRTDTAKFNQGMQQANRKLDGFRNTLGKAQRAMGLFGIGIASIGFKELITGSLDAADAIAKGADAAGFGVERFQALSFAAEQSGVSAKQFEEGVRRLNRRLGLFITEGGGPAARAFQQLGLESRIASGELNTAEKVFDAAVAKLGNVEDAASRAALASQLFGEDAGPKLALLLAKGAEGIAELESQATVMTEKTARAAERVNDRFNKLSKTMGVTLKGAIVDIIDYWDQLADRMRTVDNLAGMTGFKEVQRRIDELIDRRDELERRLSGSRVRGRPALVQELREVNAELQSAQKRAQALLKDDSIFGPAKNAPKNSSPIIDVKAIEEGTRKVDELGKRAQQVFDQTRTPFEQLNTEVTELNALLDAGKITWDTYSRAIFEAQDKAEAFDLSNPIDKATKALKQQQPEIEKTNRLAEDLGFTFTSAFENAIIEGAKFQDVLRGLAQDVARIALRTAITAPLGTAIGTAIGGPLGGFFGGLFGGARASGGPVSAGRSYLVGEKGPEMFVPGTSGGIVPNGKMGGVTVNLYENQQFHGGNSEEILREVRAYQRRLPETIRGVVADATRRGQLG